MRRSVDVSNSQTLTHIIYLFFYISISKILFLRKGEVFLCFAFRSCDIAFAAFSHKIRDIWYNIRISNDKIMASAMTKNRIQSDILEWHVPEEELSVLLKDRTTGRNLIWASDDYARKLRRL